MPENRSDAELSDARDRGMSVADESTPVLEIPLDTATEPPEPSPVVSPGKVQMVIILGSLSALGPASMDAYLPGLPELTDDFGTSVSLAQVTVASFLLGLGLGQLVSGPLSDAYGRRRPMIGSIGLYVAVTLCCALAPTIEVLIASRFLQGASAAAGIVISRAVVRDLYRGPEGARFLSRLVLTYGLAPLLAPLFGGLILTVSSWRGVFLAMACVGAALLVTAVFRLPETLPREQRRRGGVIPVLAAYRGLLGQRVFLGYALTLGLATGSIAAYVSASSFVLQDIYDLPPTAYGMFFGIGGAAMIGSSQVNAHLLRRRDPRRLLELAGSAMVGVGVALTLAVQLDLGVWVVAPCMLGLLACWGFIPANVIGLAMADHPGVAGAASAVLGIFQFGLAGLVVPLVGVGGRGTALPMAIVILVFGLLAMAVLRLLANPGARGAGSPEPSSAASSEVAR
jgi:DHA1 family bicyclomycin/chloramphenicol resistance-like MFS transporter